MTDSKIEQSSLAEFCIHFTIFVSLWNQSELTLRRILQLMLGESETAMSLAAEIQNRSLTNALRAGVRDKKFKNIREHVEHLVEGYGILLDYRNLYAHSLVGVLASTTERKAHGVLWSMRAKGRLKLEKTAVSITEMKEMHEHVSKLIGYAVAIEKELGAKGDGLESLLKAYKASLEKPTWPDKPKTLPQYLQGP
ncbi:MAG: hypothetical protein U1E68_04745 [Sphingomonadaceae bacterium]|jgi:hypothetical protein